MTFYFEKASTKTHLTLVETRYTPPLSVCFLLPLAEVIHTFTHPFPRTFFTPVSHIDSAEVFLRIQVLAASICVGATLPDIFSVDVL